jgi:hypothetical protein
MPLSFSLFLCIRSGEAFVYASGAPAMNEPGAVLGGKHGVECVLGEGGMGMVAASTYVELGQRVAIKTMKREASASTDVVSRFERDHDHRFESMGELQGAIEASSARIAEKPRSLFDSSPEGSP